jgi:hypothetical protein
MAVCFENPSSSDVATIARRETDALLADSDPEPRYIVAGDILFCGQKDMAMQLLKSAVAGHYCAYSGLQSDLLWGKLRGTPEFADLVTKAKQCRDNFLAERSKPVQ